MSFLRPLLASLLCALLLAGCGGDEEEASEPETASICEIERDGEDLDEVTVEGEGYPVNADLGFVLRDDPCSVLVLAAGGEGAQVEGAEELVVTGLVRPLSDEEAELAEFVRDEEEPDEATAETLEEVPITPGELVLDLYSLRAEELPKAGE